KLGQHPLLDIGRYERFSIVYRKDGRALRRGRAEIQFAQPEGELFALSDGKSTRLDQHPPTLCSPMRWHKEETPPLSVSLQWRDQPTALKRQFFPPNHCVG